jgi:8-oxo-dGTP pyrophosphatase MutT (NUDIX family)
VLESEQPIGGGRMATQVGALCWRVRDDRPEVLLITSRGTGRWIIPKGWPIAGLSAAEAAATEAWEEAGVRGRIGASYVGLYSYAKPGFGAAFVVAVFPLRVRAMAKVYPESGDRQRRWFAPRRAAERVQEPELQTLLAGFDPRLIPET